MHLFDPDPFGQTHERTPKATPPPGQVVAVSGARWNGTSKRTPGVFHLVGGKAKHGGLVSACGMSVVPLTIATDETRPGCPHCARTA